MKIIKKINVSSILFFLNSIVTVIMFFSGFYSLRISIILVLLSILISILGIILCYRKKLLTIIFIIFNILCCLFSIRNLLINNDVFKYSYLVGNILSIILALVFLLILILFFIASREKYKAATFFWIIAFFSVLSLFQLGELYKTIKDFDNGLESVTLNYYKISLMGGRKNKRYYITGLGDDYNHYKLKVNNYQRNNIKGDKPITLFYYKNLKVVQRYEINDI